MKQITEDEMLVLSSLVYVKDLLVVEKNKSVYDLVNDFNFDNIDYTNPPAEMKKEDLERIKETVIKNKDVYENFLVRDVTEDHNAKNVAITCKDSNDLIVLYQGTGDGYEWNDNGVGAYSNVTDTVVQQEALDFYDKAYKEYGGKGKVYVTGHSKGGNKAQYVGVLRGEDIEHVYSFDGQGFSRAFLNKYKKEIEKNAGKITSICNKNDFVNILLFPVAGEIRYVNSNTDFSDLMSDIGAALRKQHSPYTMFDESEEVLKLAKQDSQNSLLIYMGDLFRYYSEHMNEENWQYLCHKIMHMFEGNECYAYDFGDIPVGFINDFSRLTTNFFSIHSGGRKYMKRLTAILSLFGANPITVEIINGFIDSGVLSSKVRRFTPECKEELLNLVKEVDEEKWWDITK